MESRIATLLGDSSLDRAGLDPLPPFHLPSLAPPHPIEPNAVNVNDEARKTASQVSGDFSNKKPSLPLNGASRRKRQKPSVPIAGVLNHEKTPPLDVTTAHAAPSMSPSSHTPFSGRLSDLLLDPPQQRSKKRRRLDEQPQQHATNLSPAAVLTGGGSSSENKRKLPKPMQPPYAKKPKGINLPPLLQPIHQPPPISGSPLPSIMREKSRGVRSPSPVLPPLPPSSKIQERDRRDDVGREEATQSFQDKINGDSAPGDSTIRASSSTTSDKENNRDHRPEKEATLTASTVTKAKGIRKRNKWSEQETKDLLVGVSRFGIGNWKKILQCPDFTFNQRTAVDLKDRFRVCCPGDGLKLRKSRRKDGAEEPSISSSQQDTGLQPSTSSATSPSISVAQDRVPQNRGPIPSALTMIKPKRPRPESDRKGPADLAQMGIHAPFTKHKRRERREFTKTDDTNLLVGFEKYGTLWHLMRDDQDLGFTGRHATDLRDRFRIRYPEKFASAGCKPKAKDETILKEKRKLEEIAAAAAAAAREGGDGKDGKTVETEPAATGRSRRKSKEARPPSPTSSSSRMRPPSPSSLGLIAVYRRALYEPLRHSFPSPIPDFADLASDEGDADEISSPVVLSRNILQWAAEANPSSSQTVPSTTNPSSSNDLLAISSSSFSNNTDTSSLPIMNGSDGLHIDPSITFNSAPMPLLTSAMSPPSHPPPNSTPVTTTSSNSSSSNAIATLLSSKSSAFASTTRLLRTPNLPTMMHPPVPVSSAKSAIHNLPPPSDLLSGLDLDGRGDGSAAGTSNSQTGSFMQDEGSSAFASLPPSAMGVGFDASATLAPMAVRGAAAAGRDAIFQLDRDVLDEALVK